MQRKSSRELVVDSQLESESFGNGEVRAGRLILYSFSAGVGDNGCERRGSQYITTAATKIAKRRRKANKSKLACLSTLISF